ncbi:hypothetical protein Hypma_008502 [Hypsizygus marmoreus]|uniref:Uncharacterized protein n=1 Tax=Hypsizygus marmoreus TaxID=39966 RepID=A0A369JT24_HYPMA|nr:hypothetical protein Hypma_008502 [Hypsizygus marmoreus]
MFIHPIVRLIIQEIRGAGYIQEHERNPDPDQVSVAATGFTRISEAGARFITGCARDRYTEEDYATLRNTIWALMVEWTSKMAAAEHELDNVPEHASLAIGVITLLYVQRYMARTENQTVTAFNVFSAFISAFEIYVTNGRQDVDDSTWRDIALNSVWTSLDHDPLIGRRDMQAFTQPQITPRLAYHFTRHLIHDEHEALRRPDYETIYA